MFITANSCLLPVSKNPPDYVFPPLLLLYLLLSSPLFVIVFLFFFCIIVVFFGNGSHGLPPVFLRLQILG